MNQIDLLKLYQELEIDEIVSEGRVNRLATEIKITQNSEISKIIPSRNEPSLLPRTEEKPKKRDNIITENFGNMSQSEALAKLVKKQQINNDLEKLPLTSINEIVSEARELASKISNLKDLEKAVRNFEGCNLKKMATNTVFSDGDPKSKIMIIGEAPGNHEDLQGIPFCGDSGNLLNEMFSAIGLPRDKIYITNTLFWRPPGNRRPTEDELAMCCPFVEKHIGLIAPKLIVLMGATAMSSLLKINDPISGIRGKFLDYKNQYLTSGTKAISLFHPSYLMRQPNKKRLAWQDLLTIDNFLNQ